MARIHKSKCKKYRHELTKNIDPKMIIHRGEKTINKPNKSPCDIECYCNGKKDHTAYYVTLLIFPPKNGNNQNNLHECCYKKLHRKSPRTSTKIFMYSQPFGP